MSEEQSNNGIDQEFLHIFAHDIKIPLSGIKGSIEIVEKLGELNDKQLMWLQRAMGSVTRIETIVHNLLDYSRLNENIPIDREPFNMKQMVDDVVELFMADLTIKNIQLFVNIDAKLEDVIGDENLLTHVLQNIVSNAIKYNKIGGTIWITVSDERAFVRVDIQDTGIGIAAEDISKIFDRYYRGKTGDAMIKGNGLGLSIAQMIIEKHGGRIQVNSQQEHGSTFSFTLPRENHHGTGISATESVMRDELKGFSHMHRESASEAMDDVDDDTQEIIERGEDSPQDEYGP